MLNQTLVYKKKTVSKIHNFYKDTLILAFLDFQTNIICLTVLFDEVPVNDISFYKATTEVGVYLDVY